MPNIMKSISMDVDTNKLLERIAEINGFSQSRIVRDLINNEAMALGIVE